MTWTHSIPWCSMMKEQQFSPVVGCWNGSGSSIGWLGMPTVMKVSEVRKLPNDSAIFEQKSSDLVLYGSHVASKPSRFVAVPICTLLGPKLHLQIDGGSSANGEALQKKAAPGNWFCCMLLMEWGRFHERCDEMTLSSDSIVFWLLFSLNL